jgi:hypothetical protein
MSLFKLTLNYFINCDTIVNGLVFLISFLDHYLYEKNATDFFYQYFTVFIYSNSFCVCIFKSFLHI